MIGCIVFASAFEGALLGMFAHRLVPEHHLSAESKDVVKLRIARIATMAALVLSLLIASAKSNYDTRANQLLQISADIVLLDRVLARYGPETKDARILFKHYVAATIERFWPANPDRRGTSTQQIAAIQEHPPSRFCLPSSTISRRKTMRNAHYRARP